MANKAKRKKKTSVKKKKKSLNKKMYMTLVFGIITISLLVISASYAYFSIVSDMNSSTSSLKTKTSSVGTVSLNNTNNTLFLNLNASDMMIENGNTIYYATPLGKSSNPIFEQNEIARATVNPSDDANYYLCSYTLNINYSDNSLYTYYKDTYEHNNKAYNNEIVFTINNRRYDWHIDGMPSSYIGKLLVSANHSASIMAGLSINNFLTYNQTDLSGKSIALSLITSSFSCDVVLVSETDSYYYINSLGVNNIDSSWPFYVINKSFLIENSAERYDYYEECVIVNNNTVCIKSNDWLNISNYYNSFTNMGANCNSTYNNDGYLQCTYNNYNTIIYKTGLVTSYYDDINGHNYCTINYNSMECNSK